MTGPHRIRVAAHAVCVDDARVLLARVASPLPGSGRWVLPGGGLEWGKPPHEAAVREVREETGLAHEVGGTTDRAAWHGLETLDELPLLEGAAFGLSEALGRTIEP